VAGSAAESTLLRREQGVQIRCRLLGEFRVTVTIVVVVMVMMVNHDNHLCLRRNRNCDDREREG
jgi:hypothetical protein